MSVEIDPVELGFHRPFTMEVSQTLKIKNPNHTPVAFKVKTTAPKQYCVRPNSGRIEPGKEVEVNVLLQAMKEEPPLDAKCRDKFLVQSVAVTADKEFTNIAQIWAHVDSVEKSSVQEKKIRVIFLPAQGGGAVATPVKNGINGTSDRNSSIDTPAYRSPSPEAPIFTPQTARQADSPISTPSEKPAGSKSLGDAKSSASNPATDSTGVVAAVTHAVPTSVEELQAQLANAQARIADMSKEGGLRMRKAVGAQENETTVHAVSRQAQSQGVPVQIVAALCLLSFLLAYFLF